MMKTWLGRCARPLRRSPSHVGASVLTCLLAVGAGSVTASAQTIAPSRLAIGAFGGAQAVENVGGLGGLTVSMTGPSRISLFGEAAWLQDVVTRRRLETAGTVASYLTRTQGRQATGTIDAPAWATTGGVRIHLTSSGRLRPYLAVQAGVARVTMRPAFTLAGADVTGSLTQYGVTLGEDLAGTTVRPAFGGGVGVAISRGLWTLDAGLRVLTVRIKDQPANVSQLAFGIARQF